MPSIRSKGLIKNYKPNYTYDNNIKVHSAKGLFFTNNLSNAIWWLHDMPRSGSSKSLDKASVVLRFRFNNRGNRWNYDAFGMHNNEFAKNPFAEPEMDRKNPDGDFYTDRIIPPNAIQIWTGHDWMPINSVKDGDMDFFNYTSNLIANHTP